MRVSIHAPREGCDAEGLEQINQHWGFNSRTPGGVRQLTIKEAINLISFNSRTPGGVRPDNLTSMVCDADVSIHAPREGCDTLGIILPQLHGVSIHAPREGCDVAPLIKPTKFASFNSRTPGGVRHISEVVTTALTGFNSRTPGGVRLYGAKLPIMGRINKRNLRLAVLL